MFFISSGSEDQERAERIRAELKKKGISCWLEPRDITGGSSFSDENSDALKQSEIILVLLSQQSQTSSHIYREIRSAVKNQKPIVAVLLENIQLSDKINILLENVQLIHLYHSENKGIEWLATALTNRLGITTDSSDEGKEAKEDYVRDDAAEPKVFLSHDSSDFVKVEKYRKILESRGVPCWIAPRDIPFGSNYAREIPGAIKNCKCVLVFVSKHSQASENIEKEIEIAVAYKKRIIPVRLQNCEFEGPYMYHLQYKQWFNAYNSNEVEIEKLIRDIGSAATPAEPPSDSKSDGFGMNIISILALLAVALLIAGICKLFDWIDQSVIMIITICLLIPIMLIVSHKIFKKK